MSFDNSMTKGVPSDDNINKHYQDLLDQQLDTMDSSGEDVKEIAHNSPNGGKSSDSLMNGSLMTWTQMLEAMDNIAVSMAQPTSDDALENQPIEDCPSNICDDKELLDALNKIFTPVLVMQGFEKDIADQANSEMSEAAVLTERNIISFDDETRMSQLIGVCAKLIAKKKNTDSWQMFEKAAKIKKEAGIKIQKEEYDDAKALAQKYLVMVSTTNNSSVARNAANELLPQTQH